MVDARLPDGSRVTRLFRRCPGRAIDSIRRSAPARWRPTTGAAEEYFGGDDGSAFVGGAGAHQPDRFGRHGRRQDEFMNILSQ